MLPMHSLGGSSSFGMFRNAGDNRPPTTETNGLTVAPFMSEENGK